MPPRRNDRVVQRTKEKITKFPIGPIMEHFGMYLPGGKSGRIKVKCPFHEDGVASASLDLDANRFKCFGCEVSGDAVDLLMSQEGMRFNEAVDCAAQITQSSKREVRAPGRKSPSLFD